MDLNRLDIFVINTFEVRVNFVTLQGLDLLTDC